MLTPPPRFYDGVSNMHDLVIWKFATDIGLMLAVIFMAVRMLRPAQSANHNKLLELEQGLRRLLAEAQGSTKDIDNLLVKRRQDLEQLLFDLESVETRVARGVKRAEAQQTKLEREIRQSMQARTPLQQEIEKVEEEEDTTPPNWGNVNVFGEPIPGATEEAPEPVPVAKPQPKQEARRAPAAPRMAASDLARVAEAAKKVMQASQRAAQAPQNLAKPVQTRPIEMEVEVEREEPAEEVRVSLQQSAPPAAGQKLGVLGMKRSVQVL